MYKHVFSIPDDVWLVDLDSNKVILHNSLDAMLMPKTIMSHYQNWNQLFYSNALYKALLYIWLAILEMTEKIIKCGEFMENDPIIACDR